MDDVLVDGATIGHTDDTNLITLSNGTMTVDGTVAATTLTGDGSGITECLLVRSSRMILQLVMQR